MSEYTLTISLPGLKPPHCSEADIDNCKKPNISMIGTDQLDDFDLKEKAHKLSFFYWWMFSIFFGTLFANTVLVYIQDNVGWTLRYRLLALGFALLIAIFLSRTPYYWHRVPAGSPFMRMAQVMVAVVRKWRVRVLSDPKELYELDPQEYAKKGN